MVNLVRAVLILSLTSVAVATPCGHWFSSPCIGETDVRYDPDYTTTIIEQDPLWSHLKGFWKIDIVHTGGDTRGPVQFDPLNPRNGIPYNRTIYTAFYNETIVGSRFIANRYYLFAPPDQAFCDMPVIPPKLNVFGSGTCGVNGYSVSAGFFATSSFEKDGSVRGFRSFGLYGIEFDGVFRNVDNNTIFIFTGSPLIGFSQSGLDVYSNADKTLINGILETYFNFGTGLQLGNSLRLTKTKFASEDEFVQGIRDTYQEYNILPEQQVQGGVLPMQTISLDPESYPTEAEWCEVDPSCSTNSPYQEPDGTVRGGVVAGFVVAFFVLVIGGLVGLHFYLMARQARRNRRAFAQRIAETIHISPSTNMLTPNGLLDEFKRIDNGLTDGGDGFISKDELWDFMRSGMAGEITETDFNALFTVIDADGSGKVDFMEFCAFLGQCSVEWEEEVKKNSGRNKDASMQKVARSLVERSSAKLAISAMAIEEDDVDLKKENIEDAA